jgi:hypothetical protein
VRTLMRRPRARAHVVEHRAAKVRAAAHRARASVQLSAASPREAVDAVAAGVVPAVAESFQRAVLWKALSVRIAPGTDSFASKAQPTAYSCLRAKCAGSCMEIVRSFV